MTEFNKHVGPRCRPQLKGVVVSEETLKKIQDGLSRMEDYREEVREFLNVHTLYKGDYNLTETVFSEDIYAQEQEYADGRWRFRGRVVLSVPREGSYRLSFYAAEGGDIHIGDNWYVPGDYVTATVDCEGTEIVFETEDWLSMDRLLVVEDGVIMVPTKLSELENDIISVDTRNHMIYLVATDETMNT